MFIQGELGDPGSRKEVLWEKLKGKEFRSEKNVLGSFLLWNVYTWWLTPLHQHHFTGEKTEAQGGGVIVSGRRGRIGPESRMLPQADCTSSWRNTRGEDTQSAFWRPIRAIPAPSSIKEVPALFSGPSLHPRSFLQPVCPRLASAAPLEFPVRTRQQWGCCVGGMGVSAHRSQKGWNLSAWTWKSHALQNNLSFDS